VLLQVLGKELPSPFFLQHQSPNCGFTGTIVDRLRREFHLAATDDYFDHDFGKFKNAVLPELLEGRVVLLSFPQSLVYSPQTRKHQIAYHTYVVTRNGEKLSFLTRQGGLPMEEWSEDDFADMHHAWHPLLNNRRLEDSSTTLGPRERYLLHTHVATPLSYANLSTASIANYGASGYDLAFGATFSEPSLSAVPESSMIAAAFGIAFVTGLFVLRRRQQRSLTASP
jgi:hypothetical protein